MIDRVHEDFKIDPSTRSRPLYRSNNSSYVQIIFFRINREIGSATNLFRKIYVWSRTLFLLITNRVSQTLFSAFFPFPVVNWSLERNINSLSVFGNSSILDFLYFFRTERKEKEKGKKRNDRKNRNIEISISIRIINRTRFAKTIYKIHTLLDSPTSRVPLTTGSYIFRTFANSIFTRLRFRNRWVGFRLAKAASLSASGQFHRFVHPLGNGIIYKRFQRLSARSRAILTHSLVNPGKESRLLISRGRTTLSTFCRTKSDKEDGSSLLFRKATELFFSPIRFFFFQTNSFSYIAQKKSSIKLFCQIIWIFRNRFFVHASYILFAIVTRLCVRTPRTVRIRYRLPGRTICDRYAPRKFFSFLPF